MNKITRIASIVLAAPLAALYMFAVVMHISVGDPGGTFFMADLLVHAALCACLVAYVIVLAIPRPQPRQWLYSKAPTAALLVLALGLTFMATQHLIWINQVYSPVGDLDIDSDDILGFGFLAAVVLSILVLRLTHAVATRRREEGVSTCHALLVLTRNHAVGVSVSLVILIAYATFFIHGVIHSDENVWRGTPPELIKLFQMSQQEEQEPNKPPAPVPLEAAPSASPSVR